MSRSSISVFWNMAYCNLVCRYRRFGGACCLHLKVSPIGDGSNKLLRNAGNCLAVYIAPYTQKSGVFICIVVSAFKPVLYKYLVLYPHDVLQLIVCQWWNALFFTAVIQLRTTSCQFQMFFFPYKVFVCIWLTISLVQFVCNTYFERQSRNEGRNVKIVIQIINFD
jgi:hypothetical protein